jgi:hypothetical protein
MENFETITSLEKFIEKFNTDDNVTLSGYLRTYFRRNPETNINIEIKWNSVSKARFAKALMEQYGTKLNITIIATRKQYEQDINAFESGVIWKEAVD